MSEKRLPNQNLSQLNQTLSNLFELLQKLMETLILSDWQEKSVLTDSYANLNNQEKPEAVISCGKIGGQILGYNSCPCSIFLNLKS